MYTNKPRSKDRDTTQKTSRSKLEITQVFSISDTDFGKKSTTNTTSCNGWKMVRTHGKKPGKNLSKIHSNDQKNQSDRLYTNT